MYETARRSTYTRDAVVAEEEEVLGHLHWRTRCVIVTTAAAFVRNSDAYELLVERELLRVLLPRAIRVLVRGDKVRWQWYALAPVHELAWQRERAADAEEELKRRCAALCCSGVELARALKHCRPLPVHLSTQQELHHDVEVARIVVVKCWCCAFMHNDVIVKKSSISYNNQSN